MCGQVVIDLHEAQGGKAIEPGIGDFLDGLVKAVIVHLGDEGLTLGLFCIREQSAVYAGCGKVGLFSGRHAVE